MEPEASKRQLILEKYIERLEAIVIGAGFNTDAGRYVYLNEVPQGGPDDPEQLIAVIVGDDIVIRQGEHVRIDLPVDIQAVVKADVSRLRHAYLAAEGVLQDIKRAIELTDRTLGGLVPARIERNVTRTMKREPGSAYVGIAIQYTNPYVEQWGRP